MPIESFQSQKRPCSTCIEFLVAAPIVAITTVLIWQFADLVRAEAALHHAAQIAAQEAVLPKATIQSVADAATRGLRGTRHFEVTDKPTISVDDRPLIRD